MSDNRLPTRFDPETFQAGHPQHLCTLTRLSLSDLQQTLCEAIEALEQLEAYAAELPRLFESWREGTVEPHDEDAETLTRELAFSWGSAPAGAADDEGLLDTLPQVYDLENWQWQDRGVVYPLASLNRHDLQQAICQTMTAIERIEMHLASLAELVSDWREGQLRPSHLMFAAH